MARPGGLRQIEIYSGQKRRNCVKFQAVSAPDGLILHLYGPINGRMHDMTLYRESDINSIIQSSMNSLGVQYCLYGDPAHCLRPYLQVGFLESVVTSKLGRGEGRDIINNRLNTTRSRDSDKGVAGE
jgi:hypothetical protein